MRQKLQLCVLLIAWFVATGSAWDLVQVFAWGRMFAGYAQTMTLTDAAESTFDADKPCQLCRAVAQAKQQQQSTLPEGRADTKIILLFQPATPVVYLSPARESWPRGDVIPVSAERGAPPCPPPRAVV